MASIAKLVVSLGANISNFQTDMQRAGRISKRELAKMERQAKQLNDKWNRHFKMAGLAVAAGMAVATKAAIDFEKSMAEVSTLIDGSTIKSMEKLGDTVKKMSVEFGQSPTNQAKALYDIISAGASDSATQIEHLTAANKLAVGGITDVATSADLLTTAVNAYSESGLTAQEAIDGLFTTVKQGKTTIPELAASFGQVATIAASVGVSFNELNALTGTLTKGGVKTAETFSALKGIFSAVLKQTDKSTKAAKELGIEFKILAGEGEGVTGLFRRIHEGIERMGLSSIQAQEKIAGLFGRVEGMTGAMKILVDGTVEYNRQLEAQINKMGAADAAYRKVAASTDIMVARLKAAIQIIAIHFGEKLLNTVSGTSSAIINHIEGVIVVIENLAALITVRLGVAAVASLVTLSAAMAAAGTGMATAMAIAGGSIGIVVAGVALLVVNFERLANMDNIVGDFFQGIGFLAITLAGAIAGATLEIANFAMLLLNMATVVVTPVANAMGALAEAFREFTRGNFDAAAAALNNISKEADNFDAAVNRVKGNFNQIGLSVDIFKDFLDRAKSSFKDWRGEVESVSKATTTLSKLWSKSFNEAIKLLKFHLKATKGAAGGVEELGKKLSDTEVFLSKFSQEAEVSSGAVADLERQMQQLEDQMDPLGASMQAARNQIIDLDDALERQIITQQQYEQMLSFVLERENDWRDSIDKTVDKFDFLKTAMDEGVRVLTRVFSTMWVDILDGADNLWDNILGGFKSLLANLIHQATTQKIILNIQDGIAGKGTGPNGGINFQELGKDLAAFAGVIAGSALGGGGFGATFGAAIGTALGQFLIPIPILGAVVGGIVGGLIGGFVDKIFKTTPRISAGGFDVKPGDTQFFNSALGGVFVGDTKGGMDEFVAEFGAAIVEFDNAIADFLSDDQLGAITDTLESWSKEVRGEALTIEELIRSRFSAILSTFDANITAFVRKGADLVEQIGRLEVAAKAQTLLIELPDVFGEASIADFLGIVEAFKTGTKTIGEAFNEVVSMLNVIVGVTDFLKDFSASDLGADFQALLDAQDLTLTAALAGMNAGLMDAIANFDGSVESLQEIGLIVTSIREGELKLLAQIQAVISGINANLDQLKADILGLTAAPKTTSGIFSEAAALKQSIAFAETPEELARLEQQFSALIRSITPEDQVRFQSDILLLVDQFQSAINTAAETQRQTVIDNAENARQMVDDFLLRIGEPLDILAANAPQEVDYLRQIAANTAPSDDETTEDIGQQVADAIIEGFGDANLNVTININQDGGGLNTE